MRRTLIVLAGVVAIVNATLFGASLWLAARSETLHPPIGQFVDVDGLKIHYIDTGEPAEPFETDHCHAPTLVLLHGASTSLLDFESSLRPALEQNFRVLAFDRPGHGYSERGDTWPTPTRQAAIIRGALEQLNVDRSLWIAHSWAGSVVLAGLLDEAEHVEGAVLIAGATHPWEGGTAWHATMAAHPIIGPVFSALFIEPGGRLSLEEAIGGVFAPESMPQGYIENTGVTLSIRPRTYRNNADDLTHLSEFLEQQITRYSEINQPILSLTGSDDTVVPGWNHDARLAKQVEAIESVSLDGAGHAFHHTQTETVTRLIHQFIAAQSSRTGSSSTTVDHASAQSTQDALSAETCPEVAGV